MHPITTEQDSTPCSYDLLFNVQRIEQEAQRARHRPEGLAQRLASCLNPAQRILQAVEHVERHQRANPQRPKMGVTLWAFMPFAMPLETLLMAALVGCAPKDPRSQSWALTHGTNAAKRAMFEQALNHVERHGQAHEALWPYQAFSLTLGELLRAALQR